MDDEPTTPPLRLGGPADILGVLPYRIGFHPTESVVVVCLEGPRRRDRLVMRVDLPPPAEQRAVVADLAERVAHIGASSSVVVVYTDDADAGRGRGRLARGGLVRALRSALRARGVELQEALLVRDGRWWSYLCHDPGCCPSEGTPMPVEPTEATVRFAAEAVGQGETVLPDRESLRRSVEPSEHAGSREVREQATAAAGQDLVAAEEAVGRGAARMLTMARFEVLHSRWQRGERRLEADEAAFVVLGLRDTWCRDRVMTAVREDGGAILRDLLVALARQADDLDAAPVCTVLGWVAYAEGHGALAAVAAARALRCEPDYSMAQLLLDGMDRMVRPADLRAISAAVRDDLSELDDVC